MTDEILETLQADVFGALKDAPSLANAEIVSANTGDVEAEVLRKLAPLTGELRGLALVVLHPELISADRNLPGPRMNARIEVQVIEAVLVNRGTGGTQIRATTAALRALSVLHQLRTGSLLLYADRNPMEPLAGKPGIITYVLRLNAENVSGGTTAKVKQLSFALDESGDLVITTATAGAEIYYTTDGSFPGSSNDAAFLYDGPIPVTDDFTLRAAAFLSPLNPSDISEVTVSIADDIFTLNGEEVTLGGEAVYL